MLTSGMTLIVLGPTFPLSPGFWACTGTGTVELPLLAGGITALATVINGTLPVPAVVVSKVREGIVTCCDPLLVILTVPEAIELPCLVVPVAVPAPETLAL